MLLLALPGAAWAANSGGREVDNYYTDVFNRSFNGYIGSYQPNGSDATGGTVRIDSNVGTSSNNRSVLGGFSQGGSAMHNRVFMSGGTVYGDVLGGLSYIPSGNGTDSAMYNRVFMSGGTVTGGITGGYSQSSNGNSSATHNSVFLSGGTVEYEVYGGYSYSDSGHASASYNSVTISGGTVNKHVYGGSSSNATGSTEATNNRVTIMGSPTFNIASGTGTILSGGKANGDGDKRTGNTLNILTSGIVVQHIQNFQNYNFALFDGTGAGLRLTNSSSATKFQSGDVMRVTHVPGGQKLAVGHTNTLLSTAEDMTGLGTSGLLPDGQAGQGLALTYGYTLSKSADDKTITATVTSVGLNPNSASLLQGQTSGMASLNSGMDFLASAGIAQARDVAGLNNTTDAYASLTNAPRSVRPGVFAAVSGGRMRYKTNGHTDDNGISLVTGLSVGFKNLGRGQAVIGAFFELGYGDFDGKSDVGLTSDGYNRALGGGLLARYEANNGFYAEASARLGRVKNSFASSYISPIGDRASYAATSTYFGAHGGIGYIFKPVEKISLDLSTKYFWGRQNGSDVLVLNDPFSFAAMNSHRWVTGARVSYEATPCIAPYAGASFEYEFDGKARGTTYGLAMREASLRGATGGAELGVVIRPRRDKTFFIDVGAQGYLGKREGVTGSARFGLEF